MKLNPKRFALITATIVTVSVLILHFLNMRIFGIEHRMPFVSIPLTILFFFAVAWPLAWMFAWLYNRLLKTINKRKMLKKGEAKSK